jgi:TRAP-type C4-dicarboxylate transport system permease small subunit
VTAVFDRVMAFVACALVVALLVCVSLGVFTRTAGNPLIWTDELSRFLMVWLAVFGWILASRKQIHVRIRFFQDLLPARLHALVEIAIQCIVSAFGVLVAWYSIGLVVKNHDLEATSLPISMAWMYVPLVLAGAVTSVQSAWEVAQVLHKRRVDSRGGVAPL